MKTIEKISSFLTALIISLSASAVHSQQLPDTSFTYKIRQPAYDTGKGPLVLIDGAHYNFHTKGGGFFAFSRLLEQDGYRVDAVEKTFEDSGVLKDSKILVIANPLNELNDGRWFQPVNSAFTAEEISVIKKWVENGGSLLLIADHMPFAGAAYLLGKAFGFEFIDGFSFTENRRPWPPSVFTRQGGTLLESSVTKGIKDYEKIDSVATFTGSAFTIPEGAVGILKFLPQHYSLQPDTAWRFDSNTPRISLDGYHQGAVSEFGKGRVAVFGEAAMFTAQVANGRMRFGFNSESAPQNAQFVLNLIHWLDGVTEYKGRQSD